MTWTKKDFEAVAEVVRQTYPLATSEDPFDPMFGEQIRGQSNYQIWQITRHLLADLCSEQGGLNVNGNRKFDRDRFMDRTDMPKRDRITRSLKGA